MYTLHPGSGTMCFEVGVLGTLGSLWRDHQWPLRLEPEPVSGFGHVPSGPAQTWISFRNPETSK